MSTFTTGAKEEAPFRDDVRTSNALDEIGPAAARQSSGANGFPTGMALPQESKQPSRNMIEPKTAVRSRFRIDDVKKQSDEMINTSQPVVLRSTVFQKLK